VDEVRHKFQLGVRIGRAASSGRGRGFLARQGGRLRTEDGSKGEEKQSEGRERRVGGNSAVLITK